MLRFHFIDNVNPALATDDLIIWTNLLDTGTHFHADHAPFSDDSLLKTWEFIPCDT
jgi:hypothetical protein